MLTGPVLSTGKKNLIVPFLMVSFASEKLNEGLSGYPTSDLKTPICIRPSLFLILLRISSMPELFWLLTETCASTTWAKPINKNATINFTGGEPTIYKYFWNIVEHAKNRGFKLTLITNGSNSEAKDIQRYFDYFNSIKVSIDSLREDTNSLTRGKGSLFLAQTFIDVIIQNGMKPTIMVVVSNYNKRYLYEINDKYKSSAMIRYQPMYNMGRGNQLVNISIAAKEYYSILKSENIERMKEDITYKRNMKYLWCGMGRNVLSIEANGDVYPCQLTHHENFKLGDLNNQSLEKIWINSPYRHHSVDMIEGCKICELKHICSAPCRARAFYVLGSIYKKDPLCPDFIKNSIYDNLFEI